MAENLLELQEIEKTSFHNDDSSITYSLAKQVLHSKNQIMIVTGMKKFNLPLPPGGGGSPFEIPISVK